MKARKKLDVVTLTTSASQPSSRRKLTSVLALALVSAVAIGAVVGALVSRSVLPDSFGEPEPVTSAPTTSQEFSDSRPVELQVAQRPLQVSSPATGVVTSVGCKVGGPVVSGAQILAVNGVPIYGLATAFPLWRELSTGDRGVAVTAVQEALNAIGLAAPVDGTLGPTTMRLFNEMIRAANPGMEWHYTIDPAEVAWLPPTASISTGCPVVVGDEVSGGSIIVALPPLVSQVAVKVLPPNLVAGDRVIVLGDILLKTDEAGNVTSQPEAQAIAGSAKFTAWTSDPDGSVLSARFELSTPAAAVRVPPSAVFGVQGARGCVMSNGTVRAGLVLGNELGYTLMSFDGPSVLEVTLRPDENTPCL